MSIPLQALRRASITRASLVALLIMGCCHVVTRCCPDAASSDGGIGDGAPAIMPQLSALQEELLDKHCVTDCHEGINAASDLELARDRTYLDLVNRASQQLTGQIRVVPGNPEDSYLIKKMEGSQGIVGVQMPRLAPPRPQGETDALRVWITRGAPDD